MWIEVCVTVSNEADVEAVAALLQLFALGDEGVAVEQLGDPDEVDPMAMLPGTHVKLYMEGARVSAETVQQIEEKLSESGFPSPKISTIREQDWANAWKEHYSAFRVGKRLWIQPNWLENSAPNDDDIVLILDPGMAFGTGTHATTQMCLEALERVIRPNDSVLDVGCGSGILSIAAKKLGADRILGFDNDEIAVTASHYNASLNDTRLDFAEGTLSQFAEKEWDVVVANILAPIIHKLLREDGLLTYVRPSGYLILSGILDVQSAETQQIVAEQGGVVETVMTQGDWVAIVVRRP